MYFDVTVVTLAVVAVVFWRKMVLRSKSGEYSQSCCSVWRCYNNVSALVRCVVLFRDVGVLMRSEGLSRFQARCPKKRLCGRHTNSVCRCVSMYELYFPQVWTAAPLVGVSLGFCAVKWWVFVLLTSWWKIHSPLWHLCCMILNSDQDVCVCLNWDLTLNITLNISILMH